MSILTTAFDLWSTATKLPVVQVRNFCCLGAGYVGGPTMAMIAAQCPEIQVTVCDLNQARINAWNSPELPVNEPGLDEIVTSTHGSNLHFSTAVRVAIAAARLIA